MRERILAVESLDKTQLGSRVTIYRVYDVDVAGDPKKWMQAPWWRGDRIGGYYPKWRKGDLLIDLLIMRCPYYDFLPSDSCRTNLVPWTYALRQTAQGTWILIDGYVPKF